MLPALAVFGIGLATVITPITATVLASVDPRHAGIASATNNMLSRLGQMIAVAALPLAAGLSGAAFTDTAQMGNGFPVAMTIAAATSFAAALLAWTTIHDDALHRPHRDPQQPTPELPPSLQRHCAVAGTPLTPPSAPPDDHYRSGSTKRRCPHICSTWVWNSRTWDSASPRRLSPSCR